MSKQWYQQEYILQHTQQEATISYVQYTRAQISYYEHSEEIFQQIRTVKTQTVV